MSASADVLAQAKVEISLGSNDKGKNVCYYSSVCETEPTNRLLHPRWSSNGAYSRRNQGSTGHQLENPQPDDDRVQKPEWLIMLGE